MIEITIKTLDSQNHQFSVEEHITVRELKETIAESVNVPADSQRLIYFGRVLADEKKLSEYDVNGKVIHLVQRAPPSRNRSGGSGETQTGQDSSGSGMPPGRWTYMGRIGRHSESNATYLGAMAFPADIMDTRGLTARPPTRRLTPYRMSVAESMLHLADRSLRNLENSPLDSSSDQPAQAEQASCNIPAASTPRSLATKDPGPAQEDILPCSSSPDGLSLVYSSATSDVMDSALNTLTAEPVDSCSKVESSESTKAVDSGSKASSASPDESSSSDSKTSLPSTSDTQHPRNTSSNNCPPRAFSCNSHLSTAIRVLQSINNRLTPFLDEYQRLVVDESQDLNTSNAQNTFDQVSEVMHSLAHAYHALSDLICDFSQPAPRPIVCRPVLIRHSAVVQTGIPIQAQMINVSRAPRQHSSSREPFTAATSTNAGTNTQVPSQNDAATQRDNSSESQQPDSNTTEESASAAQTAAAAASAAAGEAAMAARAAANAAANAAASAISAALNSVGVDGPPGVAVRVHVDPLSAFTASVPPPQPSAPPASSNMNANPNNVSSNDGSPTRGASTNGGRNWEIFMDVGSGSINFNSLEAAMGGQNSSNNPEPGVVAGPFPWGSAPPPDFIQNLIHRLAAEIGVNNNNNSTNNNNNNGNERRDEGDIPQPRPREGSSQTTQNRNNASGSTSTSSSQPSSSSRLHYLTALTPGNSDQQNEFDPFLPCNSDHVRRARDQTPLHVTPPRVNDSRDAQLPHGLGRISEYLPAQGREYAVRTIPSEVTSQLLLRLGSNNISSFTVSELLQAMTNSYRPGESIVMDIVMTAGRYVTVEDLLIPMRLSRNMITNMRPSILGLLKEYFNMEIYSEVAVEAAINKIDNELKPFFRKLFAFGSGLGRHLQNHVDMEASISRTIQHYVPIIIKDILDGNDQRGLEGSVGRNGEGPSGSTQARSNSNSSSNTSSRPRSTPSIAFRAFQSFASDLQYPRLRADHPVFDFINALVNLVFLCCKDISISQVIMAFAYCASGYVDEFSRHWFLSELGCWFLRLQPNREREMYCHFCHRFVVFRTAASAPAESGANTEVVPMDIEECVNSLPHSSSNPCRETPPEQPLPEVVLDSETWDQSVPPDWVPIITRDKREQRRAAAQGPLSDSYLSGMPRKRRKIVTSAKPHHTLTKAISESMTVALGAAGIAGSGLDGVAENAACDVDLRSAFKEQLRSSVESTLRSHPDFTPDKYPNAAKYFNPSSRHQ